MNSAKARRVRRVKVLLLLLGSGTVLPSFMSTCLGRVRDDAVAGTRNFISSILSPANFLSLLPDSTTP